MKRKENTKSIIVFLQVIVMMLFLFSICFSQVVKDDFLVNEEDYPATFEQTNPAVARDSSGNFIVVWEDDRDGYPVPVPVMSLGKLLDIRGQIFLPDGTPLSHSFKVNDDYGMMSQHHPEVACDPEGNFVVVWQDYRNSSYDETKHDVYAQRFDKNGNPLGCNFCPVDPPSAMQYDQWKPSVGMGNDGAFVIAWMDQRNGENEIYAQRYDPFGVPQDTNFRANDESGNASIPAVDIAPSGKSVITWYDARNGWSDIWAQFYEATGETTHSYNIVINLPFFNVGRYYPDVSYDGRDFVTFVWQDYRNSDTSGYISDIYATRYDSELHKLTALDFIVDNDTILDSLLCDHQRFPRIASSQGSNNFIITWGDKRDGNQDIYARFYDSTGTALGENFRIDDGPGTTDAYLPDLDVDYRGNPAFAWQDKRLLHWDIRGRLYDTLANALGPSYVLNDDSMGAYQHESDLGYGDGNEWWVIVWTDMRNVHEDIYGQRIDTLGNLLEKNFRINDDGGYASQFEPMVAMSPAGQFVVVWKDSRRGAMNPDVYGQVFDPFGSPLERGNFRINGNTMPNVFSLSVEMNKTGRFCVGWKDSLHFYDGDGNLVTNKGLTPAPLYLIDIGDIATSGNGDFIVLYVEEYMIPPSQPYFYIQKFDSLGNEIGTGILLDLPTFMPLNQLVYRIASDSVGNIALVFEDWRYSGEGSDVIARVYDYNGNPISDTIYVHDNDADHRGSPAIDMDKDGKFIVAWLDYRNGPEVYAQKFLADGSRDGGNFRISNTSVNYQGEPSVDIADSLILYSWTDNRLPAHGNDIFAKIIGRNPTAIGLTSFNAISVSSGINLSWRTESESGISSFIVSRLDKNNCYQNIATIPGQGFSPQTTDYHFSDKNVVRGKKYTYRLTAIDNHGNKKEYGPVKCTFTGIKESAMILLSSNPCKGPVHLCCHLPEEQEVKITIQDITGRTIATLADTSMTPGEYFFSWNGRNDSNVLVSTGVYFIVMETSRKRIAKKILVIK
jgi:hypothetical protein